MFFGNYGELNSAKLQSLFSLFLNSDRLQSRFSSGSDADRNFNPESHALPPTSKSVIQGAVGGYEVDSRDETRPQSNYGRSGFSQPSLIQSSGTANVVSQSSSSQQNFNQNPNVPDKDTRVYFFQQPESTTKVYNRVSQSSGEQNYNHGNQNFKPAQSSGFVHQSDGGMYFPTSTVTPNFVQNIDQISQFQRPTQAPSFVQNVDQSSQTNRPYQAQNYDQNSNIQRPIHSQTPSQHVNRDPSVQRPTLVNSEPVQSSPIQSNQVYLNQRPITTQKPSTTRRTSFPYTFDISKPLDSTSDKKKDPNRNNLQHIPDEEKILHPNEKLAIDIEYPTENYGSNSERKSK